MIKPKPTVATAIPTMTPFMLRPELNMNRSRNAAVKQKRLRCITNPISSPIPLNTPNAGSHRLRSSITRPAPMANATPVAVCGCTRAGPGVPAT